jgi:hypothetical protein
MGDALTSNRSNRNLVYCNVVVNPERHLGLIVGAKSNLLDSSYGHAGNLNRSPDVETGYRKEVGVKKISGSVDGAPAAESERDVSQIAD